MNLTKHKPENYLYWLKVCAKLPPPMLQDFEGAVEAIKDLLRVLLILFGRMLILVLFPISVPVLAYWCWKANIKAVERRNKEAEEVMQEMFKLVQKNEGGKE